MKEKFTKEEEQLWDYIEKHFQGWDEERFRAMIKEFFSIKKVKTRSIVSCCLHYFKST